MSKLIKLGRVEQVARVPQVFAQPPMGNDTFLASIKVLFLGYAIFAVLDFDW